MNYEWLLLCRVFLGKKESPLVSSIQASRRGALRPLRVLGTRGLVLADEDHVDTSDSVLIR